MSKGKVATQSTTQSFSWWQYKANDAVDAVDRTITTCMRAKPIGTSSEYKTVWWKVDLGGEYHVFSVNILFKNYDGEGIY